MAEHENGKTGVVKVKRQCTARSKQSGQRCKRRPSIGRTVCKMHGGTARVGPAVKTWKTGRYSKYLPTNLLDAYSTAAGDRDLRNLTEEIQIVDVRVADLMGRLPRQNGGGAIRSRDVRLALDEHDRLSRAGDVEGAAAAIQRAREAAEAVAAEEMVWDQVFRAFEQRRKLVESESRRRVLLSVHVPVERVVGFAATLAASVRERVNDPEVLNAILTDMARAGLTSDALPELKAGNVAGRVK